MIYQYDATNDKCPYPLVKMRLMLKDMVDNDVCIIRLADKGSKSDIPRYLDSKGYQYNLVDVDSSIVELHIKNR